MVERREPEKCRIVMIICSNALLDDLRLEEREAVAALLLRVYREHELMGGEVAGEVAAGLLALAAALPALEEEVAAEGEALLLKLALEIAQRAIDLPPSRQAEEQAGQAMQAAGHLLLDCEHDFQTEHHFARNILFYNALLQLHPRLLKENSAQSSVLRFATLKLFEWLSVELTLSSFPVVFEGQAFANFLLGEAVAGTHEEWEHLALSTLINLLVDYAVVDSGALMAALTRPQARSEDRF